MAYDALEKEDEDLVSSYITALEKVLGHRNTTSSVDGQPELGLHDPTKRQIHMRRLVEEGRAKVLSSSQIVEGVGNIAKFVDLTKGVVDLAIQNVPQAALPWAGVCVGLQVGARLRS